MKKILNYKNLFKLYGQGNWEEAEKIIRPFMLHNEFIKEEKNAKEIYPHVVLVYSMLDRQEILQGYIEKFSNLRYSYECINMNNLEQYNALSEEEFDSIIKSIYKEKNKKAFAYAIQCSRYCHQKDYESLENILERVAIEFVLGEINAETVQLGCILEGFLHILQKNDIYAFQNVRDILDSNVGYASDYKEEYQIKVVK